MQNIVMRQPAVAPAWPPRTTERKPLHGATYFALALILLAVALAVAAAVFPDFFAGDVSQFGPGTP